MKYLEKESDFQELIKEKLVLVDFFAEWCGPCHMLSPVLEELEKENKELKVVKVDVDKFYDLAKTHGVMSIPMLEIYKSGELVNKTLGYQEKEDLEDLIK